MSTKGNAPGKSILKMTFDPNFADTHSSSEKLCLFWGKVYYSHASTHLEFAWDWMSHILSDSFPVFLDMSQFVWVKLQLLATYPRYWRANCQYYLKTPVTSFFKPIGNHASQSQAKIKF